MPSGMPPTVTESVSAQDITGGWGPVARLQKTRRQL